jgi:hypothetical protein
MRNAEFGMRNQMPEILNFKFQIQNKSQGFNDPIIEVTKGSARQWIGIFEFWSLEFA